MSANKQLSLFDQPRPAPSPAAGIPLAIRESRRARRLILRVVPPHTLELVVPRRTRPAAVQAFIQEHAGWIDDARREIARCYSADRDTIPARIELRAIASCWSVHHRHRPGVRAALRTAGSTLELITPDSEANGAPRLLRAWLRTQGRVHLTPWLFREAARVGLAPSRVQLRLQRTRWGSCSAGGISLNAALLLVDAELVRYLFVHELCHLKVMNHSRRYWRLVERFEPEYERLDRRLADAWAEIPWWVYAT